MSVDESELDCNIMLTWASLYLLFKAFYYSFLTDKVFAGELDIDKRVCRFCGKSGKDIFK